MKTSAAGRAQIIQREGRRLVAYRDTVGVLTIGVGHTGRMAPPKVTPGMRITDDQCDAFLAADLAPVEAAIDASVKVPLSQNEFDAMASLGFNIGVGGLRRSSVVRRLNLGDISGAAAAFMAWSKPAVLAGRRRAERAQFLARDRPDGDTPRHAIVVGRAASLSRRADVVKDRADTLQVASASLAVGGAATAAATHAHHPLVAITIGGGICLVGLIAAVIAVLGQRRARTLAVNAGAHAQRAAAFAAKTQHPEA